MEPIKMVCPYCGAPLEYEKEKGTSQLVCKYCGQKILLSQNEPRQKTKPIAAEQSEEEPEYEPFLAAYADTPHQETEEERQKRIIQEKEKRAGIIIVAVFLVLMFLPFVTGHFILGIILCPLLPYLAKPVAFIVKRIIEDE